VLGTRRFLVLALPVILVGAPLWLRPASSTPGSEIHPTIEPTLPLTIDLRVLPADPGNGLPPRLEATVGSSGDLQDVSLSLVLPEGVTGDIGELEAARPGRLRAGETRIYSLPLQARHAGTFPLRMGAVFRLPDGRVLQTQQGLVWRSGVAHPEGRHHAGAYECMGVPVDEPQP
jgi:hypothetical protein